MALTIREINERSNKKRGIKNKAFKLHLNDIALIKCSAKDLGISETKLVIKALKFYLESINYQPSEDDALSDDQKIIDDDESLSD